MNHWLLKEIKLGLEQLLIMFSHIVLGAVENSVARTSQRSLSRTSYSDLMRKKRTWKANNYVVSHFSKKKKTKLKCNRVLQNIALKHQRTGGLVH